MPPLPAFVTRTAFLLSGLLISGLVAPWAGGQSLAVARAAARQGKAAVAIAESRKLLAADGKNADAHALLCSLYASLDEVDATIHECEAVLDLRPGSSEAALELARAYGAKADHAGALTGMRMVGRIRENFERAAQLDPQSVEALSDLGEFYVDAPAIVGGGVDRARSLVPRLAALSPARSHRLAGMIAAKAGDTATAESEYAQELAVAHSPEAYVDLANYYRKRKLWEGAEANAVLAIGKDMAHGPDSVDAARLLIEIKRNLPVAEGALRGYLAHEQQSAATPFARVHVILGQLLQQRGDTAGAQQQFAQALELVPDYEPARKALHR